MSCSAIVDRPCVAVPRALHERTVPLGSDRMCIGASLMSIEDNLRLDADTCKDADVAADLERMCGTVDRRRCLRHRTGHTIRTGPGPELLKNEQVKAAYLGM